LYPGDANITINATVSQLSLQTMESGQVIVAFTVYDSAAPTPNTLLSWTSILSFVPQIVISGNSVNFNVQSFSFLASTITRADYGFVDASTLEIWVDDAFSNYNSASWSLFETPINLTPFVGTVASVTANDTTILAAGN